MLHGQATLDLQQFFERGHQVLELDRAVADELLAAAVADEFLPERPGLSDVAAWETDEPGRNYNIPEVYAAYHKELLQQPVFEWFRCVYGEPSRTNVMLQRAHCGADLPWHWDGFDATHIVVMTYLTDTERTERDGGVFEVGRARIGSTGLVDDGYPVEVLGRVVPSHGRVVVLHNLNPTLVHRYTTLRNDKPRFTLVGQYGYLENVRRSRARELIPGMR